MFNISTPTIKPRLAIFFKLQNTLYKQKQANNGCFPTGANILQQSFRQRRYLRSDFHYLNVPHVGTITAYDDFDCAFKCLSNPMCFSVNLASSKGTSGKLWCELLSSDKYSSSEEYKANMSSHHYSILVGYSLT